MLDSGPCRMKIYVDTCVISGHAKNELNAQEARAFTKLLELYKQGEVSLLTSAVSREEIDRIPKQYRTPHEGILEQLRNIPAAGYLVLDHGFEVPAFGVKQHSIYKSLAKLLKDPDDAKHIYQAYREGASIFVTLDAKTILAKAHEISRASSIEVLLPSESVAKYLDGRG